MKDLNIKQNPANLKLKFNPIIQFGRLTFNKNHTHLIKYTLFFVIYSII